VHAQRHTVTHATAASPTPHPVDITAAFKTGYRSAIAELTQSSQAIGAALRAAGSRTPAQLLSSFRGLSGRWERQLARLDSLKPPSTLAPDFSTVTGAGHHVASDLKAIIGALVHRSAAGGQHAIVTIVGDLIAARSADSTLQKKLGLAS
jgi:hypothetical protein